MLDPELRAVAAPSSPLSAQTIGPTRVSLNQRRRAAAQRTDTTGVTIQPGDAAGVPVRIYRGGPAPAPALVYCHAGAFALGNLDTDHRQCVELARRGGCTVVSVDYRLAPENPHPAALQDALTVLCWVVDTAATLGVDPTRVGVAGSSAGAALAAGLALRAADGAAPPVAVQLLHQPVLDDRETESKTRFRDAPTFDGAAAELMWRHYLGGAAPSAQAVPGRRESLAGAPAAFISCSEIDPLRDEAVDYARRLLAAGTRTELHVFAGTCHGFDSLLPDWAVSGQLFALQGHALRRAFALD
ncbi:alpha/beta hydrolase [Mycobacterium sp. pUA109]|uniref:alpha/beta hydrolase n=1 Tax=Mycobacterium sp. pUA109 TaxID=3238982 RepID=UPI00351B4148